ncbi:MAG: S-layer homology domain-containing protein [Firmicutes bacterium]|nr:S-layer homology domain-containing protein [Bacillota bacterium]
MSGYPGGAFHPDAPVTRAEAAKMMARAFGLHSIRIESPS